MMTSQDDNQFAQVVRKFAPQSRLLRLWTLTGGVSAQMTALEMEQPDGQTQKLIVRQHGEVGFKRNPQKAAEEFRLLQMLRSAGVPTQTPYHFDQSGEIFARPYLVIEYIDGEPEFAPANLSDYILQFARQLARIHQIDGSKLDISLLPREETRWTDTLRKRPATLDASLDEGQIRDVLEAVWPLPQRNPSVLLHGDFWPGNLLWKDGQLVAVLDWEDAAVGDPLADVANSRLEVLWAFGSEAMQRFTREYQALMAVDLTNLPYWDLCAALRPAGKLADWAGDAAREQVMRAGHRWFLAQAFEECSAQEKTQALLSKKTPL